MVEELVSERWKFQKGEKAGAGGKMGEAEKLKERETAADKQQQRLVEKCSIVMILTKEIF